MTQSSLKSLGVGAAADRPGASIFGRAVTSGGQSGCLHVGIIMDGNGRWAQRRNLPRVAGHRAGVLTVRSIVAAAPKHCIGVLTLYAFSSDNWQRPATEVGHLMRLLRKNLRAEVDHCVDKGVRLSVIGRRDRLPRALVVEIESAEASTRAGKALHLQLAIDYSSRDALVKAASLVGVREDGEPAAPSRKRFRQLISRALHADEPIPDVDLLIRTGGEQRLSDFLLWESAYAELFFTPCLWPDFDETQLATAMESFASRERRYGGLAEQMRSRTES